MFSHRAVAQTLQNRRETGGAASASARSEINTDRKRDSPERLVDGQTREVKVGEIFLGHHLTELVTAERSRRVGVTRFTKIITVSLHRLPYCCDRMLQKRTEHQTSTCKTELYLTGEQEVKICMFILNLEPGSNTKARPARPVTRHSDSRK